MEFYRAKYAIQYFQSNERIPVRSDKNILGMTIQFPDIICSYIQNYIDQTNGTEDEIIH